MDNIQQLILDTYREKPKHFTQILKRNKAVVDYINIHASHLINFLEQLYFAVYKKSNLCPLGNVMPLKTFNGYSFCGKTGICQCAKDSVSKNVSATKHLYTETHKQEINKKREETTLGIYGVTNNGQTSRALEEHKAFYNNKLAVDSVIVQIKKTKLINHGNETFNNREKCIETCLERHGVKNTWSLTEDKQNPLLIYLKDRDRLGDLFPRLSVEDIAEQLNVHTNTVHRYLTDHGFREPYKSTFEKEIIYFLNDLGITNILTNKRKIIGKELDIFLPDYNLAIEYNGVYWHHDKIPYITRSYHRDKFIECEKRGIELFTIFSDTWDGKKDIWKKKIISKLGLASEKVYARKTKIIELNPYETRDILEKNHIQGYSPSTYCYGLKYNDEVVAVMTFSKHRVGIGKDRGLGAFELVRYVTSINVVGGASKLMKHFIREHSPTLIISYSDNQYSVGKLYNILGFNLEKDNGPGYKYYHPKEKKMYHRYNYAKHILIKSGFDPNKTEFEIMDERGFLRIWGCGSRTWILNCEKTADL